jgi:uncharacterized SAM-binding protein YcdF (DUF218 family)
MALLVDGRERIPQHADLAVVLGSKVHEDGDPCALLRDRLDRALSLYEQGRVPRILVSGGLGTEGHQEADVMADYLIRAGVPAARVLRDPHGLTTYATALNTRALMSKRGWKSAIAVSTYFHLSRCRLAFERAGIDDTYVARAPYRVTPRDLYSIPRELAAWAWYRVRTFPGEPSGAGE